MDGVRQDGAGEITVLQEVETPSSVSQDVALLAGHNNAVALPDHNQQAGAATATVVDAAGAANNAGNQQPTKFVVIHLPIFHVATPSSTGDQVGVVSTSPQQHHLIQHNSAASSVGGAQQIPSSAAVILQHTPSSVITAAAGGGQNILEHAATELHASENGGGAGGVTTLVRSDDPGVGNFQCKECGKRFPKEDLLRDHFRWHIEGELSKSHRCEQCGATFSFKSNFELHKRTCNVSGFKCGLCDKVFNTRAQHSTHLRREHAAKPYNRGGKSKSAAAANHHRQSQNSSPGAAVKQQQPAVAAVIQSPQPQTTTLTIPTSASVTGTPRVVTTAEGTMVYVDVKHEPISAAVVSGGSGGDPLSGDQQQQQLLQVQQHHHHPQQHHQHHPLVADANSIVVTETMKLEGE